MQMKKNRISCSCFSVITLFASAEILLVLLVARVLPGAYGVFLLNDEFGYWGIAATLAGRDWSPLLNYTPYYSFGYSLLLIPLFWFHLSATAMYHLAITLNIVLLLISFLLATLCVRKLLKKVSDSLVILISFAANCYTGTLLQAEIAWSETLLWMLYWLTLYVAILLFEKPTAGRSILLAIVCNFSFCSHMRSLGLLVGTAVTVVFAFALKRIEKKHLLAFFSAFVVLLIIVYAAHIFSRNCVFSSSEISKANTLADSTDILKDTFFSVQGLLNFLYSLLGKLFYIGASTFMLGLFAVYYLLQQFFTACQCLVKKHSFHGIIWLFILFSAGAQFVLNAIATRNYLKRPDVLVYGRYMEPTFGPLIMLGLILLLSGRIRFRNVLLQTFLMSGLAFICNSLLVESSESSKRQFNWWCVPTWRKFFIESGASVQGFVYVLLGVSFVILFLAWGLTHIRFSYIWHSNWQSWLNSTLNTVLPILLFAGMWIWASSGETEFLYKQKQYKAAFTPFWDLLNQTEQADISKIYLVTCETDVLSSSQVKVLQAALADSTVYILSEDQYKINQTDIVDCLVVTEPGSPAGLTVLETRDKVIDNRWFDLYISPKSAWARTISWKKLLGKPSVFHFMQNGAVEQLIEVLGEELQATDKAKGIHYRLNHTLYKSHDILFGPYIQLPAGDYQVKFKVKCDKANKAISGKLATCSVTANSGVDVLSEEAIDVRSFAGVSEIEVCLHFRCRQLTENVEFVTRLAQDANVEIVSIQLQEI